MRQSGILFPITSLPSPYGIGTLGQAARDFLDFLEAAGQSVWQLLPICPTSFGDSPYQSFSSFAGNPYLIDLDDLASEGLLAPQEYQTLDWGCDPTAVDYGLLYRQRDTVLRAAVSRLHARPREAYQAFCTQNAFWLTDYALFMALKDQHGGAPWYDWPMPERRRAPDRMERLRTALADELQFWCGVQYLFFHQWHVLKQRAAEKGITIVGDLPIYVSGDSADIWANPRQFQLDADLRPTEVAGCPPDGFSADGQLWGNPLFDWERMKQDGYRWWIRRIQYQFTIYDTLRIDHFRGFDAYYAIPFGAPDARQGRWRPGPGVEFFRALEAAIGPQSIIAEDLGFLTDSVRRLLEETGYPGMKVMQFAFDRRDTGGGYLPHSYPRHCVVYTGTHDNDTILGWMEHAPPDDVEYAKAYLRLTPEEGYHWGMIRSAWASVADLAIIPMQDLLGLDSRARMNVPSTVGTNWKWRALPDSYDETLAKKLRHEAALYHRVPG